jgi:hypothetical protein
VWRKSAEHRSLIQQLNRSSWGTDLAGLVENDGQQEILRSWPAKPGEEQTEMEIQLEVGMTSLREVGGLVAQMSRLAYVSRNYLTLFQ